MSPDTPGQTTPLDSRLAELAVVLRELRASDALQTQTVLIPSGGIVELDWQQPFAAVAITNTSSGTVTVTTATAQNQAPTQGIGVAVVPSGLGACYNLLGRSLTVYGPAGAVLTLSTFSRPQPPAWGAAASANLAAVPVVPTHVTVDENRTALLLVPSPALSRKYAGTVRNRDVNPVYLGGPTVTTATGFQIDPGESFSLDLAAESTGLYGITGAGLTAVVHTILTGIPA